VDYGALKFEMGIFFFVGDANCFCALSIITTTDFEADTTYSEVNQMTINNGVYMCKQCVTHYISIHMLLYITCFIDVYQSPACLNNPSLIPC